VVLAVFPIGSANDYADSLGLRPGWWTRPESTMVRSVDVGLVRTREGSRRRYFVNGLGLGINGAVTREARRIRWLRGVPLYTLALLRAAWSGAGRGHLKVTLDDTVRETPTLALTLALGRREGNFVLAPNAVLDDGLFDYLHAGPIGGWELLRHVPGIIAGRLPVDHPHLWTGRCRRAIVEAATPLIAHTDGELICVPEDEVRGLEIELLAGRLRVQGCR
jgi:diacylglycerol kinase family enzyme